jgi:F-type H+-transporting ATPase subunit epsilon
LKAFKLKIVTPDGEMYSGEARSILVRTDDGDAEILADHADYFASLGCGRVRIILSDGTVRQAASSGGFISVMNGDVDVIATTFEYAENIDLNRALSAKERAEEALRIAKEDQQIILAKAKLERALMRISVANRLK